MFDFRTLIARGVLGPTEKEAREQEAVRLSAQARAEYEEKLRAMVNAAVEEARQGSFSALKALADQARSLDVELDERLAEIGVLGFHDMETEDGRRLRVPAYLEEVAEALREGTGDAPARES